MYITEIIQYLEAQGTWVDWTQTRDYVLFGDANKKIQRLGVCWVATKQVIEQAIEKDIHFIISHENPFYHLATSLPHRVRISAEEKRRLLKEHDICVYRCHDVWDKIPEVGVRDTWAKRLGFTCEGSIDSYVHHATIDPIKVGELAKHVAHVLHQDGEDGVYVFGNINKEVERVGLGTGAATNIFEMLRQPCDVLIACDDGITNFYQVQYAIDNEIPMIIVNHAGCEIAGIKGMATYLQQQFPSICCAYIKEGYDIHYYVDEMQK